MQRGGQQLLKTHSVDVYGGAAPKDLPAYGITEAARYLGLAPSTLRTWVIGRSYPNASGKAFWPPLIRLPEGAGPQLSFTNLVEGYVLKALRIKHAVPIREIRNALDHAQSKYGIDRLLIRKELRAAPGNLFLAKYGQLINLGKSGQLAMKLLLESYLERLDRDDEGFPTRLFPIMPVAFQVPASIAISPRHIMIDPRVSFGRPILISRGITTGAIVDRIDAGETVEDVAEDYGVAEEEIKEAVVYERAA